jgi:hypothetical protein
MRLYIRLLINNEMNDNIAKITPANNREWLWVISRLGSPVVTWINSIIAPPPKKLTTALHQKFDMIFIFKNV